jgi:pimeloyl-ACP methyl ester carboxylesterase
MDMHLIPGLSAVKSTNVRTEKRGLPPAMVALRRGLRVLSAVSTDGAAAVATHLFLSPKRHQRLAAEHEVLADARHLLVPTEDGPLASWEWGTEGPRVLLVHGWEGRGAQLGPLVEPLLAQGFRVVTFDAPGHGSSPGNTSSLVHFARAIERVAQAYGPLEAIIAHSMGGAAATWAFRAGPLAARLVMIAPPSDVGDFTRQLTTALRLSDEVRERVNRRFERRLGVPMESLQMKRLAPRMTTPLLVLHDEGDREVPITCAEAVVESWPGAVLVRTHGLGHRRILADPDVIRRAVRFVSA